MDSNTFSIKSSANALRWCAIFILISALLIIFLPIQKQTFFTYHLTTMQYRIVELAIAIPTYLVWLVAFWGYSKLKDYSAAIKNSKEASGYAYLATGLMWLAWSLPISSILNSLLNAHSGSNSSLHSAAIIISNYIYLVLPLVAFILIYRASGQLLSQLSSKLKPKIPPILFIILFIFGVMYCFSTLKSFNLGSLSSTNNPYHLPAWLMILTIILPYLYAWLIGLIAAYKLNIYAANINGVIYRRALKIASLGLSLIVVGSVASQYISTTKPSYGKLELNLHLILDLLFKVLVGIGFFAISFGVSRLRRIEEV